MLRVSNYYSKVNLGKHFTRKKSHQEDKGERKVGRTIVSYTGFHRIVFEPGNFMLAKYLLDSTREL